MDRRRFLSILPGFMAVKQIAKELPPLVTKPVEMSKGLLHAIKAGHVIMYRPGYFDLEMFKSVMGDLFYGRAKDKEVVVWTSEPEKFNTYPHSYAIDLRAEPILGECEFHRIVAINKEDLRG